MKIVVQITAPYEANAGRCVDCALAIQTNDRFVPELQPDGSYWPLKPYPWDIVLLESTAELHDHLREHQRAGHLVSAKLLRRIEKGRRLTHEMLKKIRAELKKDPAGMEYAGKSADEQWHLFNCILVPFKDELGNRIGYTSRANLLLRTGIRLEDVVMATYNS